MNSILFRLAVLLVRVVLFNQAAALMLAAIKALMPAPDARKLSR